MEKQTEQDLSFQIAQYLQLQYPNVLYHIDFGTGARLPMGLAMKQKRLNKRSWPDLFIAQLKNNMDGSPNEPPIYCGLFIELKREGTKLYLKDGKTMVANPHLQEQALMLRALESQGYKAVFGVGFTQTKEIIDGYLKM